jgi:hypothetical protein
MEQLIFFDPVYRIVKSANKSIWNGFANLTIESIQFDRSNIIWDSVSDPISHVRNHVTRKTINF